MKRTAKKSVGKNTPTRTLFRKKTPIYNETMKYSKAEERLEEACEEIGGNFRGKVESLLNISACVADGGDRVIIETKTDPVKMEAEEEPVNARLVSEGQSRGEVSDITSIRAATATKAFPQVELTGRDGDKIILESDKKKD